MGFSKSSAKWKVHPNTSLLLGARVRHSAHGKGHEEGGSPTQRRDRASGVPLEILEHLPP